MFQDWKYLQSWRCRQYVSGLKVERICFRAEGSDSMLQGRRWRQYVSGMNDIFRAEGRDSMF
jgi:hypothetical protein